MLAQRLIVSQVSKFSIIKDSIEQCGYSNLNEFANCLFYTCQSRVPFLLIKTIHVIYGLFLQLMSNVVENVVPYVTYRWARYKAME